MITPLVKLAAFWHDVYLTLNNRENWKWLEIPDEANEAAKLLKDFKELLKWVQVLSRMMSDTWRVALSVFFLRYVGEPENFWKYILDFIRNLALYVCYLSIREGSGNDMQKVIIYSLNNKICKEENTPERYFQIEDSLLTKDKLETSMQENCTTKFGDCLVILQAYLKPEQDFCIRLEVEHIRPQSWRNDDPQEEQPNIDWLGNKIALDKKANIKSKDKWLSKKAKKYSESPVKIAKEFAEKYGTQDDWSADDIKRRDNEIIDSLWDTFSSWSGSQSSSNFAMP